MKIQIKRSDLPKGDPGAPGRDGYNGVDGNHGLPGADGTHGLPGRDGLDGKSGIDGKEGRGFSWKGQWSPQQSYQPYDVVRFSGSSFICLQQTKGILPSTRAVQGFQGVDPVWDLMSVQGDAGPQGTANVTTGHGDPTGTGFDTQLYVDVDSFSLWIFLNGSWNQMSGSGGGGTSSPSLDFSKSANSMYTSIIGL